MVKSSLHIVRPLIPQTINTPIHTVALPAGPSQMAPLPDLFNSMPRDVVVLPRRPNAPVPAMQVRFVPPAPSYAVPAAYAAPSAYAAPVSLPAGQQFALPTHLIKDSRPQSYREKLNASLQRVGETEVEKLEGAGKLIVGAAKTAVYAPLGAIEAVGRTAVALTGGQVAYPDGSPLDQVGDGVTRMGEGSGQVILASGKQAVAVTESLVYAPLATLEVGAHGAGMVVGGVVRAGSWVGQQVSESFIGREFAAGYREAMPSRN